MLILVLLHSCTTEKNAFLNRNYHYITVKYNGFFNGNEAFNEAKKNISSNHTDDFDNLIDVFQFGNEKANKNYYSNLNRAVKKGAKMIDRHSMKFKVNSDDVEFNQMIDNCYLLIGKARFLKYDLEAAKETFLFIKNTYKKGDERYKAWLWLVLTYIYQENFVDAETTIIAIHQDKEFPEKFKDDLAIIEAINFKRNGDYAKAIPAFENAIDQTKNKKLKRRLQFILAQLYQKEGAPSKASDIYKLIAKKATNYDLQFNAKINLATTYEGDGGKVAKILEKMLKDFKNKEYQDQIYFALAKVYEKQGQEENAIENYKMSARKSVNNQKQKGKSFLALGNYYFEQPDYINAANYFDSTLIALPKEFPNYQEISNKNESLKDLVKHLKIVQVQDSLLQIVAMSEEERTAFVAEKIARAREAADLQKIQQDLEREKAILDQSINGNSGATWIFDNPSLLAAGKSEFVGLWGDRALEDNWRRDDKTSISFNAIEQENEEGDINPDNLPDDQTVEYYLKNLPIGVDKQEIANQKIINSYYQLGVLYRDNFNDLPNSIYYFNKLNSRFPRNYKEPITLYQLYRNYDKVNKTTLGVEVKNKLVKDYPTSEYTQLLLNPNMLAEQEQKRVAHDKFYQDIFVKYKQEQYENVVNDVKAFRSNLGDGELAAKFDLINAFSKGNIYGKDSLEFYLKKVYKDNIGTEVANDVDLILGGFARERAINIEVKKDSLNKEKAFVISENEPHYFVMIFSNETNKSNELLNKVSNFNKEYYSDKKLNSKSIAWSDKEDVVVVKPFRTNSESGKYYGTVVQKFVPENPNIGDLYFMISKSNYTKLFKFRDVLRYIDFYKRNYSVRK